MEVVHGIGDLFLVAALPKQRSREHDAYCQLQLVLQGVQGLLYDFRGRGGYLARN